MKKVIKLILTVILSIVSVFLLVFDLFNIGKMAIYEEYYSIKTDICENPGLNDGFVCQGIGASEKNKKILISGYMNDNSNSRIYVTDYNSNSYYVKLEKNGQLFKGHVGGLAITNDNVYLANSKKIYTISLTKILNSKNGDVIDIGDGEKVNNSASFVYSDESYLYVGEFHDGGKYVTEHPYQTAEGMHYAIISRYDINDLSKPNKIYSVRDRVQGTCFTPDGKVIFSTSYGLTDTIYYMYNESDAVDSGLTLDGAPVYYLEDCVREIHGPAMGEDLDYFNGKVISLTESASNKYIFGKFFFANKIFALDFKS